MERTIIYVFGPKRLAACYYANKPLSLHEGGWLKIGQTSCADDNIDKYHSALDRINEVKHTGIPEVCLLYDVFEYPKQQGNTDDRIRQILTNEVYNLENSKEQNRLTDKHEIQAGREFVYGVSRNQVLNAVAKFERDLLCDNVHNESFNSIMQMVIRNREIKDSPFDFDSEQTDESKVTDEQASNWGDGIWNSVLERIRNVVNVTISNPKGRPYIFFRSSQDGFNYDAGYSVRYGTMTVGICTFGGEAKRDEMEQFIDEHQIRSRLPMIFLQQGVKNKEKWMWCVSESTQEKSDKEIVDWFATTILQMYQIFG